jgi:hypothetical protein
MRGKKKVVLWLLVAHRWQWRRARWCQAWVDNEEVLLGIDIWQLLLLVGTQGEGVL